jgi:tetratricopeptide (TPR) repeat protein
LFTRILNCWLLLLLHMGIAGEAHAQRSAAAASAPTDDQAGMGLMDEEARQHYQLGKNLYDGGRFADAAEEFEQAYKLASRPQLLYNLYVAYRDASNWPKAIESLRAYLDKVQDAPDRVNLRARLQSMEAAAAAQAEQEAQAAKAAEQARAADEARAAAEARAQSQSSQKTRTEVEHSIVPVVLFGVGAAVAIGGGVTGVLALGTQSDLDAACGPDKQCPKGQSSNIDKLKTMALVTDILIPVGATMAAVGAIMWLTGALDSEHEVPAVAMGCGATGCEATWSTRF